MIFASIPISHAEGAILAHRVGTFRKGRVLSRADLDALAATGVREVTAARLEPTDMAEDEAAARIARSCAGPDIRIQQHQLSSRPLARWECRSLMT